MLMIYSEVKTLNGEIMKGKRKNERKYTFLFKCSIAILATPHVCPKSEKAENTANNQK